VVVAGAALISVAAAEVNNTPRPLSSNLWFILGLVLVILGVAIAVIGGVLHFRREVPAAPIPEAMPAPDASREPPALEQAQKDSTAAATPEPLFKPLHYAGPAPKYGDWVAAHYVGVANAAGQLARDAAQVAALLDSPEIAALISELEATRWTGRPGYPLRAMVGLALVKSLYAIPTWTRMVALVKDHAGLRDVLGAVPSTDAAYRFTVKLRQHGDMLTRCIAGALASLHDANPEMGKTVAIDGSDLPAYANGQRYVKRGGELRKRFADPDASRGHRSSISTRSGGG
jgi:hypothetical protein